MASPSLHAALEAVRTRLRAELDEQLSAVEAACTASVAEAHLAAHAAADERWTAKFEALQKETTARAEAAALASAAVAATADERWTRQMQGVQAESAARQSAAAAEAGAAADERWTAKFEALQKETADRVAASDTEAAAAADGRWAAKFEELQAQSTSHARVAASEAAANAASADATWQARLQAQADSNTAAAAVVAAEEPASGTGGPALRRVAEALKQLSAATSLSSTLDAFFAAARLEAPRTALYVVNGFVLELWKASGFVTGPEPAARIEVSRAGALGEAVTFGRAAATDPTAAPPFAAGTAGAVLPLMVGGQCVAVLYADGSDSLEAVQDTIGILAQHAASCLSRLTAEALAMAAPVERPHTPAPARDDSNSARRYARLLVSEIKLYNEAAVRVGRERRDLLSRLRPDIDRARRLYEERVPPAVASRDELFQQELVHTLAEGDSALLGAPD